MAENKNDKNIPEEAESADAVEESELEKVSGGFKITFESLNDEENN